MRRFKESAILSMKSEGDFRSQQKDEAPVRMWVWLTSAVFLGAVFVICAVFYVWLYVHHVQNGYRLAKIYEESELYGTVQRKLIIEWSRFRDPQRLGEIGMNQFGLAPPRPDQKVVMR
jgi:hypothetical protein